MSPAVAAAPATWAAGLCLALAWDWRPRWR